MHTSVPTSGLLFVHMSVHMSVPNCMLLSVHHVCAIYASSVPPIQNVGVALGHAVHTGNITVCCTAQWHAEMRAPSALGSR